MFDWLRILLGIMSPKPTKEEQHEIECKCYIDNFNEKILQVDIDE